MRAIYGMVAVLAVTSPPRVAAGAPSKGTGSPDHTRSAGAEAKEIYTTRCFTCHGMQGRDGPGLRVSRRSPLIRHAGVSGRRR